MPLNLEIGCGQETLRHVMFDKYELIPKSLSLPGTIVLGPPHLGTLTDT